MSTSEPSNYYTLDNGCPVFNPQASLRIGSKLQGPHLIRDINLLETISHITHERIPERLVHAKGAGAWGEFEVAYDPDSLSDPTKKITEYTDAAFLNNNGKKTTLFARFSTVIGERGSADSVRDARGFAFKMYTEEGNLDWLFFSTPTFPIRDGGKFPSFVHAQKRDPQTGLKDANTFWDFMSRNPETFHSIMSIFSDRGTPKSYRNAHIYGVNTYKFTKGDKFYYVKIHLRTNQGIETFTQKEAEELTGTDPDAFTRDLHDHIATCDYPSWTVYAQIMDPNALDPNNDDSPYGVNIFDPTKTVPKKLSPLIQFGKITLNRNPSNEFGEVEQVSFNPTAIVPGWDISADPILQTRLFAYGSASRYRLGINLHQIPVNAPQYAYNPAKRDGVGYINNLNPSIQPNYFPADDQPVIVTVKDYEANDQDQWKGGVISFESKPDDKDWCQPRNLWDIFKLRSEDDNFVSNVAVNLQFASKDDVRERTYGCFRNIADDLGNRIKTATEELLQTSDGSDCDSSSSSDEESNADPSENPRKNRKSRLAGRNQGGVGG